MIACHSALPLLQLESTRRSANGVSLKQRGGYGSPGECLIACDNAHRAIGAGAALSWHVETERGQPLLRTVRLFGASSGLVR